MSAAYRNRIGAGVLVARSLITPWSITPWLIAPVLIAGVLAGCASRPAREQAPPVSPSATTPSPSTASEGTHQGRALQIIPEESLLTVLVFRGGPLGKAGHNHVIASHDMSGFAWVPSDVSQASFEVHVPVGSFTIDEPALRAQEGADFAADVPDSAREGTKKNMLSEPMLDGQRFPEMVLRSSHLEPTDGGAVALVDVTVRGQTRPVTVPLRYEMKGNALLVKGELSLRQTELGLTPFSLLGGALRVEDEMRVRVSLVARGE